MLNEPHLCSEWDEMLVLPGTPEMEACLCDETKRLKAGDKLRLHGSTRPETVTGLYYSRSDKDWLIFTLSGICRKARAFREL